MKIGYPCINNTVGCTSNKTFRIANYSKENLINKTKGNLDCLQKTLEFNAFHQLLFFRIGSGLVPFASHEICTFNWQDFFREKFSSIGRFIKNNDIRISMHPDQFVVVNSLKSDVVKRSIAEIKYHCEVLDLLNCDKSAKIQIHVGGVYGDKKASIKRFVSNYKKFSQKIIKRLVIENDDKLYSLKDCLFISEKTGIPVIFDSFHHLCLNNGESFKEALVAASQTWKKEDGIMITDYSSQKKGERKGSHAEEIDLKDFKNYISETKGIGFDIMLEIKDKEKSALKALEVIKEKVEK